MPGAFAQIAPGEKIFEPQIAVHAPSRPTGLLVSKSGRFVYAGEGGMIAVLEPTDAAAMRTAVKRFPVSSRGILPVAMALDPLLDVEEAAGDPADALLFVAAGRDGLWIVGADPREGYPNPAVRVDDSGNTNPTSQMGRRWACDLDFATVGGVDYLLCLFAKADQSRLRLYRLSDLRNLFTTAQGETGQELAPALQVLLNDNPDTTSDWHSFAFGMTVDHQHALENGADVYVALGAHGLVRVRLAPPQSGPNPTTFAQAGPWFGDGSVYADPMRVDQQGKHLHGFDPGGFYKHEIYDDVRHWNRIASPPNLERSHPPIFTDVAVHAGFVYAAVESCGWVRFSLTSQPWGPTLPVDHHEGWHNPSTIATGGTEEVLLSLGPPPPAPTSQNPEPQPEPTWTRRIVVSDTDCGPVLAVTTFPVHLSYQPGVRNDGRSLGTPDLAVDSISLDALEGMTGEHAYTLLYDLSGANPFTAAVANHGLRIALGGEEVCVPAVQPHCATQTVARWLFYAGHRSSPVSSLDEFADFLTEPPPLPPSGADGVHATYRVLSEFDPPAQFQEIWVRGRNDRRGRYARTVSSSLLDERILITGGNDNGVMTDGALWLCDDSFRLGDPPTPGTQTDTRNLQGGILFNPRAQWLGTGTQAGKGFYWGTVGGRWALTRYSGGQGICDDPLGQAPSREVFRRFEGPLDRFLYGGRNHYRMGTVNAEYDAYYAAKADEPGARLVFASRAGSDWGVVVLRLDVLEPLLPSTPTTDALPADSALVGNLVTHSEFSRVNSATVASNSDPRFQFIARGGLDGDVTTLAPSVFPIPQEEPTDPRWFLAIPSAFIAFPPDLTLPPEMGTLDPTELPPAPFDTRYRHGLIQIIEITDGWRRINPDQPSDPTGFTTGGSPDLPIWSIVCERENSYIGHLEVVAHGDEHYIFACDVGGELLVYRMSDVLALPPGAYTEQQLASFASFVVSDDVTDPLKGPLYSVALDTVAWVDVYEAQREETYVYLGVARVGVEVLRFEPAAIDPQARLEYLGIVQTPGETEGLWIRTDPVSGQRQLLIGNTVGGIRVLEYSF